MVDIPNPKKGPPNPWFNGKTWQYVKQAYYAVENGMPKFPDFRAAVDIAGKDPKTQVRVELGGVAKWLLGIKDTIPQRREDHPQPRG